LIYKGGSRVRWVTSIRRGERYKYLPYGTPPYSLLRRGVGKRKKIIGVFK